MKKLIVIVAILAAAAACGGAGTTATTSTTAHSGYGSIAPAPALGAPAKAATVPGGAPTQTSVVPTIQGPQVIRQAQLSITVSSGSFDSKLTDVRGLVQLQGGFISGTDAQANPAANSQIRTGVITFMIPAAKLDDTINQLTAMGKVQNLHISGNDVSAQYVDLQARLVNEEAQRDAMLALLQRAQSVQDIIAVQNQLGQITGQIEQLKGQIQYIDHNTAYSTVTVDLMEAGAPVQATSQDNWGFASALSDAAHNFVTTLNYIVTGLGAIGPIVIVLGLGYLLWRRRGFPGWPTQRQA
jgi:uncharacterized protein DUF4349